MDSKTKQILIEELSRASTTKHPVAIKRKGKSLAVVLPVEDYKIFEAKREEKLKKLKTELNGILALIRTHIKYQSLEEIETELATLRQKIEEEMME